MPAVGGPTRPLADDERAWSPIVSSLGRSRRSEKWTEDVRICRHAQCAAKPKLRGHRGRARRNPGQQPAPPSGGASRRGRRLAADARQRRLAAALVSSPSLRPPATLAIGAQHRLGNDRHGRAQRRARWHRRTRHLLRHGYRSDPECRRKTGDLRPLPEPVPGRLPARPGCRGRCSPRSARSRPTTAARAPPRCAQVSTATAAAPARCSSTRKTDRPRRGSARGSRAIATAPRTSVPARFLGTSVKRSCRRQ